MLWIHLPSFKFVCDNEDSHPSPLTQRADVLFACRLAELTVSVTQSLSPHHLVIFLFCWQICTIYSWWRKSSFCFYWHFIFLWYIYVYNHCFVISCILLNVHSKGTCTHGAGMLACASTRVLELRNKCLLIGGVTYAEILKMINFLGLFFVIAYTGKDLCSGVF